MSKDDKPCQCCKGANLCSQDHLQTKVKQASPPKRDLRRRPKWCFCLDSRDGAAGIDRALGEWSGYFPRRNLIEELGVWSGFFRSDQADRLQLYPGGRRSTLNLSMSSIAEQNGTAIADVSLARDFDPLGNRLLVRRRLIEPQGGVAPPQRPCVDPEFGDVGPLRIVAYYLDRPLFEGGEELSFGTVEGHISFVDLETWAIRVLDSIFSLSGARVDFRYGGATYLTRENRSARRLMDTFIGAIGDRYSAVLHRANTVEDPADIPAAGATLATSSVANGKYFNICTYYENVSRLGWTTWSTIDRFDVNWPAILLHESFHTLGFAELSSCTDDIIDKSIMSRGNDNLNVVLSSLDARYLRMRFGFAPAQVVASSVWPDRREFRLFPEPMGDAFDAVSAISIASNRFGIVGLAYNRPVRLDAPQEEPGSQTIFVTNYLNGVEDAAHWSRVVELPFDGESNHYFPPSVTCGAGYWLIATLASNAAQDDSLHSTVRYAIRRLDDNVWHVGEIPTARPQFSGICASFHTASNGVTRYVVAYSGGLGGDHGELILRSATAEDAMAGRWQSSLGSNFLLGEQGSPAFGSVAIAFGQRRADDPPNSPVGVAVWVAWQHPEGPSILWQYIFQDDRGGYSSESQNEDFPQQAMLIDGLIGYSWPTITVVSSENGDVDYVVAVSPYSVRPDEGMAENVEQNELFGSMPRGHAQGFVRLYGLSRTRHSWEELAGTAFQVDDRSRSWYKPAAITQVQGNDLRPRLVCVYAQTEEFE